MNKGLRNGLLLTLVSLALTILIIEGGVRIWEACRLQSATWSDRPEEYFAHEEQTSLQDFPRGNAVNKEGFRIAVVGDSFTFAPYLQIEDTFPKRLERWLNLNSNQPKVEVFNLGVPRYSSSHEIQVVKDILEQKPQIVLLQITLNDPELKPYTPRELDLTQPDRFAATKLNGGIYDIWRTLALVKERLNNSHARTEYIDYHKRLFAGKRTWNSFRSSIEQMKNISDKAGAKFIAVIFPLFGIPSDRDYPFDAVHSKVSKLLTELNVPHLDLLSAFNGIPLERLQVIPGVDRHPNEIAHRIAAEKILKWWEREKILPPSIFPKKRSSKRIGLDFKS